ncbi:hypothetical protein [uncultured Flavobacterium sp.]|uniref:hypothetical protein n=1 Tax=uncultured Flavobacterium sp. TaxID=165435 RepID=UPI0030CA3A6D|tara:strand:- start:533 stop:1195 length:663 start_codon:yes stop_codon:yes gene_type:complete
MYKIILLSFFLLFLFSCEEDNTKAENEKFLTKNLQTFNLVNSVWIISTPNLTPSVEKELSNWNSWQQFIIEINQKPKSSLTAFQLKTKNLSTKIDSLQLDIPAEFDKPQVKSRITALSTKMRMLDNFINLTNVPEKKIKQILPEINQEIASLVGQFEEIFIKKQIPNEAGEAYMIQALDTIRNANPEIMMDKINQQDSVNNPKKKIKKSGLIKPNFLPIK